LTTLAQLQGRFSDWAIVQHDGWVEAYRVEMETTRHAVAPDVRVMLFLLERITREETPV